MFSIGLAEDDPKIADLIKKGLEEEGYALTVVHNGLDALEKFNAEPFDLFLLDVMMPELDGVSLCKRLKRNFADTPVLMLTALGEIDNKVEGFNAGADDYLVKPFHFRELSARVKSLLKRYDAKPDSADNGILSFEDLILDSNSKEVKRAGNPIDLTAKETALLELFLRNPNRLLSRQYIASTIWDITFDTGTNVIDVYINFLRKKIEKGFDRKLIHTKIGMGYIMK